jgi:hypothetical protein
MASEYLLGRVLFYLQQGFKNDIEMKMMKRVSELMVLS